MEFVKCEWCKEDFEEWELQPTSIGNLCEHCLRGVQSRENIEVYERY